jgi:hypothetical protein
VVGPNGPIVHTTPDFSRPLETMFQQVSAQVRGLMPWNAPGNLTEMKALFGGRYIGNTIQLADPPRTEPATSSPPVHDVLVGSMLQAAGVHALNAYSFLGFAAFDRATCQSGFGDTCGVPELGQQS